MTYDIDAIERTRKRLRDDGDERESQGVTRELLRRHVADEQQHHDGEERLADDVEGEDLKDGFHGAGRAFAMMHSPMSSKGSHRFTCRSKRETTLCPSMGE